MSILTAGRPGASNRSAAISPLTGGLAVAFAAAVLGYAVHHLPPLQDHPALGVAVALLGAAATALGLAMLVGNREAYQLPAVLVAAPSSAETRAVRREELEFCAALHSQSLGHGFFVGLGPRFLRAYYATFLDSPHAVAFAATVSGQPVAVLVGILQAGAHARWLVSHRGPVLALHGVIGMARHPGMALRFIRTRLGRYARAWRRHRRGGAHTVGDRPESPAVLSHVAVLPGARGIGAGGLLVRAFEGEVERTGHRRAILNTLEGADGAGGFYASLGWTRSGTHSTPDGRRQEEWTRSLGGRQGR
jgi:GNAT superfamily N-acetyltransferase